MTIIVGIRCIKDVVIGTDSAAMLALTHQLTIQQSLQQKIEIIQEQVIVGGWPPDDRHSIASHSIFYGCLFQHMCEPRSAPVGSGPLSTESGIRSIVARRPGA